MAALKSFRAALSRKTSYIRAVLRQELVKTLQVQRPLPNLLQRPQILQVLKAFEHLPIDVDIEDDGSALPSSTTSRATLRAIPIPPKPADPAVSE